MPELLFTENSAVISSLLAFILFTGTLFLTWQTYKNRTDSGTSLLLTFLRASTFTILIILLINPVIERAIENIYRSKVLFVVDNSKSVAVENGVYQGLTSALETYNSIINMIDTSQIDLSILTLNDTKPDFSSVDNLINQTDLSRVIRNTKYQTNVAAMIVMSDGNYNVGQDPTFNVEKISFPIITIALSDTIQQSDVLVESVIAPTNAFRDVSFTATATIVSRNIKASSTVNLLKNRTLIEKKSIQLDSSTPVQIVEFSITPSNLGLQQYSVEIESVKDEFTDENNYKSFAVNVLDGKLKVLHIAASIHPDVKSVRSVLNNIENIELRTLTRFQSQHFLEAENPVVYSDSIDVIIYQGMPDLNEIEFVGNTKLPTIYIPITTRDQYLIQNYLENLIHSSRSILTTSFLTPQSQFPDHPIRDSLLFDSVIPLTINSGITASENGYSAVINAELSNSNVLLPVVLTTQNSEIRSVFINIRNLFTLGISNQKNRRDFLSTLIGNSLSWVVIPESKQLLELRLPKQVFDESEYITLSVILRNQRYELEDDALVTLRIKGENQSYPFENAGKGHYSLRLNPRAEGSYAFTISATKGEQFIAKQDGNFLVQPSNAEFIQIDRNSRLLRNLAYMTNGMYVPFNSVGDSATIIKSNYLNIEPNVEILQKTEELYQFYFWFILILFFLTLEWLIRKYKAIE